MRISRQSRSSNHLRRIVAEMGIPVPWNRDQLVAGVAARRGRPIHLVPVSHSLVQGGHSGLWLARAEDDVILYAAGTSDVHATHIICHELAHMELGHDRTALGDRSVDATALSKAAPSVDPSSVVTALGRSNYSSAQEYEAELLATLLMARRGGNTSAATTDPRASRILGSF
ncbi:M48 family metalloprotease [Rhodococcus wratislaviensis]|uniref:IrrE N-terminal-like domain-containing protein n=1 Tax=Rhodococcus wratislaviensis NBRC 100605 TaxID=1219028 RepID=X0QHT0_RHOWR|nr:hypothetical protein [Rhodococcus wratislaviensis]GAF50426.1 hypothetical protein RW1_095_00440 [Rhodococcus wratislaviensis NBRC 100605]